MKKISKSMLRCMALIVSAVLILTTSVVYSLPATADDEVGIVYTETMSLTGYVSIEAADGSTDVTMAQASIAGPGDTGYVIKKTDGSNQMLSGSVIYGSTLPLKDVQFVTGFSDNPGFLGSVKFYASSDCETWEEITTERTVGGTYWGPGVANSQVYDTCSFDLDSQIRYVKIEISKGAFDAPGIRAINYNTHEINLLYLNQFDLTSAETEEGSQITASPAGGNGYFVTNSSGTPIDGSMIYYDENGISDYFIEYAQVFSSYGEIKFYISKDGSIWENAPGTDKTLDRFYAGDANCHYHEFSGTLLPKWGYKYFKVSILKGDFHSPHFPVVFSFKYNNADQIGTENPQVAEPVMKDRYEIRTSAERATAIQADGYPLTNVYGVGDNLKYNVYAFWDMEAWQSGNIQEAWKPGIIEYSSEEQIIDYRIKGIWNGGGDIINVYCSSDGDNWIQITPSVAEVGDFSNPNWGAFTSKWYYGTFTEKADVHYIRIEMVQRISWLTFLPGICFIDYNTISYDGLPERPDSYVNTSVEDNYFLKDDEYITFKSGSTMTDYDLRLIPIEGQTPEISISRDGSEWIPSAAVSEDMGDGTVSYYDALLAEDGYMYLKLKRSTAEFVELKYNIASGDADSTRRHYEMPELTDDIEDFDYDKVVSGIHEGVNGGIIEWTDLSPTMNNDQNATFIGGKYGIVGAQGEGSILFTTPNINDFKLRVAFGSGLEYVQIKAYGRTSQNGEETEIPLMRVVAVGYENCGFKNYIFRPADRDTLAEVGYQYIRIEMTKEIGFMDQILDFEYFYKLPVLVPMPDFTAPDTSKGEMEIRDDFSSIRLTVDEGGKAYDSCYLQREERVIGTNNPSDTIIRKTYFMAESYVVYRAPELSSFDIRAYKSADCITDLIIYVSADGENWEEISPSILERAIYDGYKKVAYTADKSVIGSGMNYIKIEIPDLEGSEYELTLYDLQLLHTSTYVPGEEDDNSGDTGYNDGSNDIGSDDTSYNEPEEETNEITSENTEPTKRKKVVKVIKKGSSGLYWWEWTLIAVGGVIAIAAAATTIIIIVKKKRKKALAK